MKLWIDAHLSPALAQWLSAQFDIEAVSLRDLSMVESEDPAIFDAARDAGAVVMTKDRDFVDLVQRLGPPPQILWITSGNTSNARMREILSLSFADALTLLRAGEPLVEIGDAPGRGGGR